MSTQQLDFSDIAPYEDDVFHEKMKTLVKDPGFLHAINYIMPADDVQPLLEDLLKIENKYDFQHQVMFPFLEMLAKTTTSGISLGGVKYYNPALNYVFITNHRDIVLDASFLNLAFMRRNMPVTEVAIGNNLLVFDWINDLVRLNKSFIVKRNTVCVRVCSPPRSCRPTFIMTFLRSMSLYGLLSVRGVPKIAPTVHRSRLSRCLHSAVRVRLWIVLRRST